jgi:hypothetical protein
MWFQAIYPFKARQILNQTLSLVIAKVMYTFNLAIYTVKQPNYPHQVTNKPADNIKRLVEPQHDSRYLIYGHQHCFLSQQEEAVLCGHYKKNCRTNLKSQICFASQIKLRLFCQEHKCHQ